MKNEGVVEGRSFSFIMYELHNSTNFSRLLGSKPLPIFVHIFFLQQKYWVFQLYSLYDCVNKSHSFILNNY